MKHIQMSYPGHPEAKLEGYVLDCELTLGQEKNRPAVIVCPGGGYVYCSPREGEPVALRYGARGIHAFVLTYSTGWDAANFAPLQELSWAIGYLRENAEEWHIDPNKILTCGFSAGGHLALAAGLMGENRPNGMILGYPAVTIPNMPGADYMLKLLTGKDSVTDEDAAALDLLAKVDKNAPPVFLAATAEDFLTPSGALALANRYTQMGLGYELHVFQHGPHGMSLGDETTADGSSQVVNDSFAQWQDLSIRWMQKVFGKPEFVDKSTSKMAGYLKELGITLPGMGGGFA